jgi:hypothetical protein
VSLNRFGGTSKFKLSVARLEAILGGVVRDDLAKLTVGSIYTKRERWPGIGTMTRGGRRRGCFTGVGVLYHGIHSDDQRRAKAGHSDAVEMPGHAAQGRKAAVTGVLI